MKNKIIASVIIAIILIVGGYYGVKSLFPKEEEAGVTYSTYTVAKGDIDVGVDITGNINPSWGGSIQVPGGYSYDSSAPSSYIIQEIYAKEGDEVIGGQPIIKLAAPSLATEIDSLESQLETEIKSLSTMLSVDPDNINSIDPSNGISITAPIDGRLTNMTVKAGTTLDQGAIIGTIVDDSKFTLTAKLSGGEFGRLKDNYEVMIRFPGLFSYSEAIEGQITNINYNPIPEKSSDLNTGNGIPITDDDSYEYVYWVDVEADNPGLIQPGMTAEVTFYDPTVYKSSDDVINASSSTALITCRYYSTISGYATQEEILSQVEGVVTKVKANNMSALNKGDVILTMAGQDVTEIIVEKLDSIRSKQSELADLEAQQTSMTIVAPCNGVLSEFDKTVGTTVSPGEWLGSVFSSDDMQLYAQVDDIDVVSISVGATAIVTVDALPGQTFEGTVQYVDSSGQDQNGTYTYGVYLTVKGSSQIKSGMQAQAKIGAQSASDVLLVPLEAIFREEGQNKVETLDVDGIVHTVNVEIGLMNNSMAEITSGLEEGDMVITGSTADLLPSDNANSGSGLFSN